MQASDEAQKRHASEVGKNAHLFKNRIEYPEAKVLGHGNQRAHYKESIDGCPYRRKERERVLKRENNVVRALRRTNGELNVSADENTDLE